MRKGDGPPLVASLARRVSVVPDHSSVCSCMRASNVRRGVSSRRFVRKQGMREGVSVLTAGARPARAAGLHQSDRQRRPTLLTVPCSTQSRPKAGTSITPAMCFEHLGALAETSSFPAGNEKRFPARSSVFTCSAENHQAGRLCVLAPSLLDRLACARQCVQRPRPARPQGRGDAARRSRHGPSHDRRPHA